MQRPAGERREAGAEDGAGVDEVAIGDDSLVAGALGFVEEGFDQILAEAIQFRRFQRDAATVRFALFVIDVEAPTALAAKSAVVDH